MHLEWNGGAVMPRIRTIKPEFPQSESMGRVHRESRLCFIQLWTLADDAGRLRGNSRMLASLLYPYDLDAGSLIGTWLNELEKETCIQRYQINGDSYIQIINWLTHQRIDRPSESKIPPAPSVSTKPRESSSDARESSLLDQGVDQGSRNGSGGECSQELAARPSPQNDSGFKSCESTQMLCSEMGLSGMANLSTARGAIGILIKQEAGFTPKTASEELARRWAKYIKSPQYQTFTMNPQKWLSSGEFLRMENWYRANGSKPPDSARASAESGTALIRELKARREKNSPHLVALSAKAK